MRHPNDPGTLDLMTGCLLLGYARVSTEDQELINQRNELQAAGCSRVYAEKITGAQRRRSELDRLLDHLRPGDVVTVTRLDRLARSTRDLLDIAERIQEAGAGGFVSKVEVKEGTITATAVNTDGLRSETFILTPAAATPEAAEASGAVQLKWTRSGTCGAVGLCSID